MKKLFFLTFVSVFTLQAVQTKTNLIKLITADNHTFNIPEEVAFLSPTIKDFVSSGMEIEEAEQKQVTFNEINSATLQPILQILERLNDLIHKQNLGKLGKIETIQRPDGGFIAQNLQPIVDSVLKSKTEQQAIETVRASNFLDMKFLVNAAARVYVEKVLVKRSNIEFDKLQWSLKGLIPQELLIYFRKHWKLAQLKVNKELSIADFLAMDGFAIFGKPHNELIFYTKSFFSFVNAGLTSLAGVELIEGRKNIEFCNINDNHILDEQFDPEFPEKPFLEFNSLRQLNLDNNQLTKINERLFNGLHTLARLAINNNQISIIENGAFDNLSRLLLLDLDNNKLQRVPTIKNLNLEILQLNNNEITDIELHKFEHLSNLDVLNLEGNKIQKILNGTFANLVKLDVLHLESNMISTIEDNAFWGLPALTTLYLQNNKLSKVSLTVFDDLSRLQYINLLGNTLEQKNKDALQHYFNQRHISFNMIGTAI